MMSSKVPTLGTKCLKFWLSLKLQKTLVISALRIIYCTLHCLYLSLCQWESRARSCCRMCPRCSSSSDRWRGRWWWGGGGTGDCRPGEGGDCCHACWYCMSPPAQRDTASERERERGGGGGDVCVQRDGPISRNILTILFFTSYTVKKLQNKCVFFAGQQLKKPIIKI